MATTEQNVDIRTVEAATLAPAHEACAHYPHLHEELANALEALRASEDVVAIASHELRGPLTSVLGFSARLRKLADRGDFSESVAQQLSTIHSEARRMQDVLDLFLRLAVFDADQFQVHLEELDLREILLAECEAARLEAAAATIEVSFIGSAPFVVRSERNHIRSIISNMVSNALKYGGDPANVAIGAEASSDSVIVSVRDNGDGIADEDVPHIFERFYRSPLSRAGRPGVGLGLYIAQQTAHRLGAEISFDTIPGRGTEFRLRLPVTVPN